MIGLAFDLVGAVALAQGLLASPTLIVMRARYGAILVSVPVNTPQVIAEVRDRVAARAGLVCLCIGFVLQGAGYLLAVSGVDPTTGDQRVAGALVLAATAVAAAVAMMRALRRSGLRRGLAAVAEDAERYWREHKLPATGYYLLCEAAEELGWLPEGSAPDEVGRTFRVEVYFHDQTRTPHLLSETSSALAT